MSSKDMKIEKALVYAKSPTHKPRPLGPRSSLYYSVDPATGAKSSSKPVAKNQPTPFRGLFSSLTKPKSNPNKDDLHQQPTPANAI